MDPYVDNALRNWVPPRKCKTLNQASKNLTEEKPKGLLDELMKSRIQRQAMSKMMKVKAKEVSGKENEDRLYDESPNRRSQSGKLDRHPDESNESELINAWEEIQEVIESDFLISPGDIYPSRKVQLQDAEVSD